MCQINMVSFLRGTTLLTTLGETNGTHHILHMESPRGIKIAKIFQEHSIVSSLGLLFIVMVF